MKKINLFKIVIVILFICFMQISCFAFEYTIDTAREEALKNIPAHCMLPNGEAFRRSTYHRTLDTNNILASQQINKR